MGYYTVTKDDLRGDISEFPIEVVQAMVDAQTEQGNEPDVMVYLTYEALSDFKRYNGETSISNGFKVWYAGKHLVATTSTALLRYLCRGSVYGDDTLLGCDKPSLLNIYRVIRDLVIRDVR